MIIHVITGLSGGGAEAALMAYIQALSPDKRPHHMVVSLTDEGVYGPRLKEIGVSVAALGMARGRISFSGLWHLRELITKHKPTIIHGWLYHANLAASMAALLAFCPSRVIWSIHNALGNFEREKPLTRLVIKTCGWLSFLPRKIVYVAKKSAQQHEALGYRVSKTVVIPNGYDLTRFSPDQGAKTVLCSELNIKPWTPLVGLNARWDWTKDHATFFAAFARTQEAHAVLMGAGISTDNPELMSLIHQHRLEDRVHLLGFRPDVEKVTAGLDILCLSSCTEAQPNAVGEAMACGVPVVATHVGDVDDMVGGTGFIVPPQDPSALGQALNAMLQETPGQRQLRGQLARSRVETYYSLEKMVEAYESIY